MRELVVWFEGMVSSLTARLNAATLEEATDIVRLAMEIRGYGPVKEAVAKKIRSEVTRRLDAVEGKAAEDLSRAAA